MPGVTIHHRSLERLPQQLGVVGSGRWRPWQAL